MSDWEAAPLPMVSQKGWEPVPVSMAPASPGIMDTINTGVNWLGTRGTKALTGIASTARGIAALNKGAVDALGLPPALATAANFLNPLTAGGQFMPSSPELNRSLLGPGGVAPEVNLPGPIGKAVDTGTEFALQSFAGPGSFARNALPSFVGGASSELAGQAAAGTKWEPWARLLGGVVPGGLTALIQNGAGSVVQAIRNIAPNVNETSAKVIARALIRDQDTAPALAARQADLGPGAIAVEAGGPNMRGTMRGSIAAPGEARTTVQNVFDERRGQLGDIATSALDRNISPNGSVSSTVDELSALRRQAATPAYEAAGIPRRPESHITAMDEPPTWNTRQVTSPELEKLVQDSPDIRQALNTLRRFPDYKNVPANSMSMWDEAYKLLGGKEQEAVRAGNNRKAMLIGDLRRDYQTALVDANPDYGRALKAYAGPSKLIDAAETGKDWFKPGIDSATVAREFQKLPAAEQDAARIGVRDWARSMMERSDRSSSGVPLWSSPANRSKLQAILSPGEYADLEKQMNVVKNAAATANDINVGSRTTPMLNEQADNMNTSAFATLLRGHPLLAASKFAGGAVQRIGEGRNEAVNARIAKMLSSTDPAQIGMVNALAERARLAELARRSGRMNALTYGGLANPYLGAAVGGDR